MHSALIFRKVEPLDECSVDFMYEHIMIATWACRYATTMFGKPTCLRRESIVSRIKRLAGIDVGLQTVLDILKNICKPLVVFCDFD